MKLKFALVGLLALGGAALTAGTASAMPVAPLSRSINVESVALVCGPNGCVHRAGRTRLWLRRSPWRLRLWRAPWGLCLWRPPRWLSPLVIGTRFDGVDREKRASALFFRFAHRPCSMRSCTVIFDRLACAFGLKREQA